MTNVAEFFNIRKNQFHTIAVSLQPKFFVHADALVGVTGNVSPFLKLPIPLLLLW